MIESYKNVQRHCEDDSPKQSRNIANSKGQHPYIIQRGASPYAILGTILFILIVLSSCTNSRQEKRIFELEEENKLALQLIDSLKQTDAFKFNEILLKESGNPDDTMLIKEYETFLDNAQTDFWINLVKNRIFILKIRPAKQAFEKKIFGTWEWVETHGGWETWQTPETKNETRKITINEDYTILYFKNGVKIKQDSFYLTSTNQYPYLVGFGVSIHFVNQRITKEVGIVGAGHNDRLTFYEIGCMDCPSERFKRVTTK